MAPPESLGLRLRTHVTGPRSRDPASILFQLGGDAMTFFPSFIVFRQRKIWFWRNIDVRYFLDTLISVNGK